MVLVLAFFSVLPSDELLAQRLTRNLEDQEFLKFLTMVIGVPIEEKKCLFCLNYAYNEDQVVITQDADDLEFM